MSLSRSPQLGKRHSSIEARSPVATPRQDNRRVSMLAQSSALRSPPSRRKTSGRSGSMLFNTSDSSLPSVETFGEACMGDLVEGPGGWHGKVMYVGPVEGRSGTFLGVDLIELDADKGRHNGSHNGVSYFTAKSPTSGMFVPQGRCRVMNNKPRTRRTSDNNRPESRQLQIRAGPMMRSVSGRSASGSGVSSPPRSATFDRLFDSDNPAAAQQRLLNDNARLAKELTDAQMLLKEQQTARAVQAQEMEDLIATVSEFEAMRSSEIKGGVNLAELEEMRLYIEEREQKIEQLRAEAEIRRTEFKQVTEHQEVTIEQLKSLHKMQLSELEERNSDMEERLLHSAGDQAPFVQAPEQMELLQAQLAELSEELDALVFNQERARQDIEMANSRIGDLENENNRLLDELAEAHIQLEQYRTNAATSSKRSSRRISSMENLPDGHPQKRQAVEFLENEIRRLEEENEVLRAGSNPNSAQPLPNAILEELNTLQTVVDQLQEAGKSKVDLEKELESLKVAFQEEQAALAAEKAARKSLEEQHDALERTLEQTIMQMEAQSPVSTRSSPRSGRKIVAPLSPIVAANVSVEPDLRSPRAGRGSSAGNIHSDGILFCEYCEQHGHDIVSCKAVFGSAGPTPVKQGNDGPIRTDQETEAEDDDQVF